jgi:hypothetical protein
VPYAAHRHHILLIIGLPAIVNRVCCARYQRGSVIFLILHSLLLIRVRRCLHQLKLCLGVHRIDVGLVELLDLGHVNLYARALVRSS